MSISVILLTFVIILITFIFCHVKRKLNYWRKLEIPHKKPSLLEGNFQGFQKTKSFAEIATEHYNQFKGSGPFSGCYFIHRAGIFVLDLILLKNILIKDFNNFSDRGLFSNEKDDPLTGRLFLLDGVKWKNMRSKLSPTFSSGKMKAMYPLVLREAEQLVQVLNERTCKDTILEIKDIMARFTTDVIGSCAFGINCNSLRNPQAEFRIMGLRSLTARRHGHLITNFIQGFPNLARKLHMCITPDDITDFFVRIVKESLEYRKKNNIETHDLLSILSSSENNSKDKLSIEQMAAQAFVFFLGGFETSSSTLAFILYEIALQEKIQDKLRQEINEAYKEYHITYEALHNLKYMGQVISETLRKYPIVPVITRQCLSDYPVPGHPRYVIKKGMLIMIPIYAFHHDPALYPEPEKFKPERFESFDSKSKDSLKWLAFGEGPRNCIGLRFGIMQIRIALAYLLHNFRFSICQQTEIPIILDKASVLLSAKNGIYLKVEQIHRN